MSATEDRIRELAKRHFGRDVNFAVGLAESEIPSLDIVAFLKKVGEAFDLAIPNVDATQFENLGDVVKYIDTRR